VFIAGVEEGLFPHKMSVEEPGRLEEERRLCYVGVTRAMQKLYLTHAETRRLHGKEVFPRPSRFLRELPPHLLEEVRASGLVRRGIAGGRGGDAAAAFAIPARQSGVEVASGIRLGSRVRHARFGDGMVTNYEGSGESARVQVNFEFAGQKWLVLAFANLEVVS